MKTANKYSVIQAYKLDGDAPVIELLRLSFKSGGANAYLPRGILEFLHLNKESRSLVAFLDSEGPYNFIIVTSDKNLSELLKPLILERRRRAEEIMRQLSTQQQQAEATTKAEEVIE